MIFVWISLNVPMLFSRHGQKRGRRSLSSTALHKATPPGPMHFQNKSSTSSDVFFFFHHCGNDTFVYLLINNNINNSLQVFKTKSVLSEEKSE